MIKTCCVKVLAYYLSLDNIVLKCIHCGVLLCSCHLKSILRTALLSSQIMINRNSRTFKANRSSCFEVEFMVNNATLAYLVKTSPFRYQFSCQMILLRKHVWYSSMDTMEYPFWLFIQCFLWCQRLWDLDHVMDRMCLSCIEMLSVPWLSAMAPFDI